MKNYIKLCSLVEDRITQQYTELNFITRIFT
jgi:hypothetical protein